MWSAVQARNVDIDRPIRPLPPTAQQLLQRLEQLLGVQFDQLTVNEYQPGVGLSSHVDTHSAFTGERNSEKFHPLMLQSKFDIFRTFQDLPCPSKPISGSLCNSTSLWSVLRPISLLGKPHSRPMRIKD